MAHMYGKASKYGEDKMLTLVQGLIEISVSQVGLWLKHQMDRSRQNWSRLTDHVQTLSTHA